MKKCRIIKRTFVDGTVKFVIQEKHFLFKWWWVNAWMNSSSPAECIDSFNTMDEALDNLPYFRRNPVANEEEVYKTD